VFGAGGGTSSYKEVEDTDLLILWGSNARETHPIFFHHVLKAVHRGAKLYGVDPRRSSSAQWADTSTSAPTSPWLTRSRARSSTPG
jgi:anaerobic selenocysteine-containing dehydrogenase